MKMPSRGDLLLVAAALALTAAPQTLYAGDGNGGDCRATSGNIDVTVTRIRYCNAENGLGICNDWQYAPGLSDYFANSVSNIANSKLEKMYVAKVWEPDPADVKNVVFLSGGQNEGSGVHNGVTGQINQYKWNDQTGMTRTRNIAANGIAAHAMTRFNPADTALVLIWDAQYDYQDSSTSRNEIKNAFRNWAYSLADDPEIFYWAGSSRGGCLGFRIVSELTHPTNFPKLADTNFIVQGIDPVCRAGEFGITNGDKIQNPFENSIFQTWKAHETDIRAQFGDDEARISRVSSKIIATGDQVAFVAEGFLPWGEWSDGSPRSGDDEPTMLHISDDDGNLFYEGSWAYIEHIPLGRNYCNGPSEGNDQLAYRNYAMLHHLDNSLARFACRGHWTYQCYHRTGCPVGWYTCQCDPPYINDGADHCVLDCPPGQSYDVDSDSCVDLCDPALNLVFDPTSGSCVCAPDAHWSPTLGCVVCDTDWDFYNQDCCPDAAPLYDSGHNECYGDCGPDAYWDFDPCSNLGHCDDYCPPCYDPVFSMVCSLDKRCRSTFTCVEQCSPGEICGTVPGRIGYDLCLREADAADDPDTPAPVGGGGNSGGSTDVGAQPGRDLTDRAQNGDPQRGASTGNAGLGTRDTAQPLPQRIDCIDETQVVIADLQAQIVALQTKQRELTSFVDRGCEAPPADPGDSDGDGIVDTEDNCPQIANPAQLDWRGRNYRPGERIVAAGELYECREAPRNRWCAFSAYAPGRSSRWSVAWRRVGDCGLPDDAPVSRPCTSAPWTGGTRYQAGDEVTNKGDEYRCRPWPNSGWCSAGGFEPGVSPHWQQAWIHVRECP